LGSRARPGSLANPMLPAAIAAALSLQLARLYVPFLRQLLHTEPLTGLGLLVVFVLSSLGYAAIRVGRVLFRRKRPAAPPGVASRDHR
jgi:P-type Ca2+ transporter type 2C